MRLRVWEPFRNFKPFYGDFERWFDETAGVLDERTRHTNADVYETPKVDVYETDDSYVLKADLPGLKKEDIKIDVHDNTLTFKGEKKVEKKTEKDNYVRVERSYGSFKRSFTLSDNVDSENIKAGYKDGVLEITLVKKEEAKPKEINIEVN